MISEWWLCDYSILSASLHPSLATKKQHLCWALHINVQPITHAMYVFHVSIQNNIWDGGRGWIPPDNTCSWVPVLEKKWVRKEGLGVGCRKWRFKTERSVWSPSQCTVLQNALEKAPEANQVSANPLSAEPSGHDLVKMASCTKQGD